MRLDIGCGQVLKPGFSGVDVVPFPHVQHVCDVTQGLPFPSDTVEEIYSSHFLEHLAEASVLPFLRECHRVLRPRAILDLCVPDLPAVVKFFLEQPEESRWGFPLQAIYGNQSSPGEFHRTGFGLARLARLLREAGFQVERCENVWDHQVLSIHAVARKPG